MTGAIWYRSFVAARATAGLDDIPASAQEAESQQAVVDMPSFRSLQEEDLDDTELSVPLVWMLSSLSFPTEAVDNVGSHSLKVTLSTLCGKFKVPSEQRQLLGFHTLKKDASVLNYNRDNLAEPIDGLCKALAAARRRCSGSPTKRCATSPRTAMASPTRGPPCRTS